MLRAVITSWIFASLLASTSEAITLNLSVKAPTHNALSDSCFTFTDSGWVALTGSPLVDLKDIRICWRNPLDPPSRDSTLFFLRSAPGESLAFSVNVLGPYGVISAYARDTSNNESCLGEQLLYALPDSTQKPPSTEVNGLRGSYYTYDRWTDFKTFLGSRIDTTINFDWGAGASWPTGPADYWSVRWMGQIFLPLSGTWTFYLDHNDGVRLWVNGVKLIDRWLDSSEESMATTTLVAGQYPITLEYYEGYSSARCHLFFSGPGISKQIISKGALTP